MNRIAQLALSEEGFVFDPTTGESYTVNRTGLHILKSLKESMTPQELARDMSARFEIPEEEAERDVCDFIDHLRTYRLW